MKNMFMFNYAFISHSLGKVQCNKKDEKSLQWAVLECKYPSINILYGFKFAQSSMRNIDTFKLRTKSFSEATHRTHYIASRSIGIYRFLVHHSCSWATNN